MTTETVPGSVQTTDNLRIAYVPPGSNAHSLAVLQANTTKLVTYALTPDGWDFPKAETETEDKRLTLGLTGSRPGKQKLGPIQLKYVFGSLSDIITALFVRGLEGTLVYRDILPNDAEWALGQKVDEIDIVCGRQRKDNPAEDGLFLKSQTLYVQAGGFREGLTIVA
jgi:hypothetical protein